VHKTLGVSGGGTARGAQFLTEPKDHGREIRACIRDPDGHLIEVGQTTARLASRWQALPVRMARGCDRNSDRRGTDTGPAGPYILPRPTRRCARGASAGAALEVPCFSHASFASFA